MQTKFPDFLTDIEKISNQSRVQVIEGLLEIFKFQHTIQIIRWLGDAHENFDKNAWDSISAALKERMEKEERLTTAMKKYGRIRTTLVLYNHLMKKNKA